MLTSGRCCCFLGIKKSHIQQNNGQHYPSEDYTLKTHLEGANKQFRYKLDRHHYYVCFIFVFLLFVCVWL